MSGAVWADADGWHCDDVDPRVGVLDACGVCNAGRFTNVGAPTSPKETATPMATLDALGECGGPCVADADADGICDDVDPCVGELTPVYATDQAIYECGCDIPEGDCD